MSIVRVAKLAGLSHATVSRVINNQPGVAPETVNAVLEAMRRLNYVPPTRRRGPQARTPRNDGITTRNIALLMFGEDPTLVAAPVTAVVLHAIERALAENGFNLMVGQVNRGRLPHNVESGQVDGLLLHGPTPNAELSKRIRRFPAVWLLSRRDRKQTWGDRVEPDNAAIGRLAAQHLLDRGHRRLAVLYANPTHLGYPERASGFEETAREAGAEVELLVDTPEVSTVPPDSTSLEARVDALVERLVSAGTSVPTGLFVPRDRVTVLVYRALRRRQIRPGEQIEVVSCDNENVLDGLDPRPPSIDIRPEELGRRAVEQLFWRLRNPHAPVRAQIVIEPRLVVSAPSGFEEMVKFDESLKEPAQAVGT